MCGVSAGADLADGLRITGTQAGIASDAPAVARCPEARLGALGDQRPLEDLGHYEQSAGAQRTGQGTWVLLAWATFVHDPVGDRPKCSGTNILLTTP